MRLSKDTILTYLVAVILALAAGFGGGYLGTSFHLGPRGEAGPVGASGSTGPPGPEGHDPQLSGRSHPRARSRFRRRLSRHLIPPGTTRRGGTSGSKRFNWTAWPSWGS